MRRVLPAPMLPFAALGLTVLLACTRDRAPLADAAKATVPAPAASSAALATAGAGAFGDDCEGDGQCASAVCFHKRLKTTQSGPEGRGGGEALEREGYCSMRCDSDGDCPTPPSSGRCGARGMCKRPEARTAH